MRDLLIQLESIEYQYSYDPETQLVSSDRSERGKVPSYAVENLTNLLDGIDLYKNYYSSDPSSSIDLE